MPNRPWIVIKGAGDIASAVAHRIKQAGGAPVLLEVPLPLITRRRMAFAPVLHGEPAELEGLSARLCATPEEVVACMEDPTLVPVVESADYSIPFPGLAAVVVDGRMRKKEQPPLQLGEAPLVLGIGPGFQAGHHVHGVVESNWGETLGAISWEGAAQGYTGIHRKVEGHGADRYLYAPHAGVFRTTRNLLEPVQAGEVVGMVQGGAGETPLTVLIGGVLRGLAYDGSTVQAGAKLVEVEPRGDVGQCTGIAERPGRIADGVLAAIRERAPQVLA